MNGGPWGSGGQRSRLQEAELIFVSLAETSFSIFSVAMSDGNLQLKKGGGVLHPRVCRICILLTQLFHNSSLAAQLH